MASKLYPTLSTFYKAGNVGFGSEHDAMLCGVPDEKLYRKPSMQRGEISQIANAQSTTSARHTGGLEPTNDSADVNVSEASQIQLEKGPEVPPLIPSAPPLLEMLDLRLQQYLNMLLAPGGDSNANVTCTMLPSQINQPLSSVLQSDSDSHKSQASTGPTTTVTLPLPPNVVLEDSWLDEIRPDYDDLTPEQIADEILNNLNVAREGDAKDHEKQKTLSLLKTPRESQTDRFREDEDRQRQQPYHNQDPEHRGGLRHTYQQQQSTQSSRDDNADIGDGHQQQQQQERQQRHYHQRQRNISHHHNTNGASRLSNQSHEDARQLDRLKRPESAEKLINGSNHESAGMEKRRHAVYPHGHRRSHHHTSRGRHKSGQSSDLVEERRESSKSHRKALAGPEKENQRGSSGRAEAHTEHSDYNAWMTWRKQVNRQLATIILLKQQGKNVTVQTTDMRRKPLRQSSIDFVSQIAMQSGSTTSLGGKPYVMYGIPRASLLSKNETASDSRKES